MGLVLTVTLLAASGGSAGAQSSPIDQAAAAYEQGLALVDDENWSGALAAFQRAYSLSPNFQVWYDIGQCYRALHRYPDAIDALRTFLDEGGDGAEAQSRVEVEQMLRELRSFLATLRVQTAVDGAAVSVDGDALGTTPLAEPIVVGAGSHVVRLTADGYAPFETEIAVAGGDDRTVTAQMQPLPVVPPPPPPPPPVAPPPTAPAAAPSPWYEDWVGWTLSGVGLACGGVAGGLLWLADDRFAAADAEHTDIGRKQALRSDGDTYQTAGFAVLGVGAAALVAGVIVFAVDAARAPDPPDDAVPLPTVSLLPGGLAVCLGGSF